MIVTFSHFNQLYLFLPLPFVYIFSLVTFLFHFKPFHLSLSLFINNYTGQISLCIFNLKPSCLTIFLVAFFPPPPPSLSLSLSLPHSFGQPHFVSSLLMFFSSSCTHFMSSSVSLSLLLFNMTRSHFFFFATVIYNIFQYFFPP